MENKHAALIAAAILTADQGIYRLSSTKEIAEQLESWLDSRP